MKHLIEYMNESKKSKVSPSELTKIIKKDAFYSDCLDGIWTINNDEIVCDVDLYEFDLKTLKSVISNPYDTNELLDIIQSGEFDCDFDFDGMYIIDRDTDKSYCLEFGRWNDDVSKKLLNSKRIK